MVERDGQLVALLVHDPAVLGDPGLAGAVSSAAGLAAANACLQAEMRASMEIVASQGWASRRKTAQGLAQRARIVLMCADGKTNVAVAAELGITRETAGKWRNRFVRQRFAGLSDEPRPGVPRTITDAQIEEVVVRTLEEVPEGGHA